MTIEDYATSLLATLTSIQSNTAATLAAITARTTTPVVSTPVVAAPVPSVPLVPTPPVATSGSLPAVLMTADYPLNQPATKYPVETRLLKSSEIGPSTLWDPQSIADCFKQTFGPNHIRFDTTIPYDIVDSSKTPNIFTSVKDNQPTWGAWTSDASKVPCVGCTIEHPEDSGADHHAIIYDQATGLLHELFRVAVDTSGKVVVAADGSYSADGYRCWDVSKNEQGSLGQTSADAAGLPILPLLLRYDEAATGIIKHALRFTINVTRANSNNGPFCAPASHAAGGNWSSTAYMGMRFYRRPDFPIYSGTDPILKAIDICLGSYGIVLADNGISGLVCCDNNPKWDTSALSAFAQTMTLADFIPVNSGALVDSSGAAAV